MGQVNWSRTVKVCVVSALLLATHAIVFINFVGSLLSFNPIFFYTVLYTGWFLAIALPLNWYFLTEPPSAELGMLIAGMMSLMIWIVNLIIQLPEAIFVFVTRDHLWIFDWDFPGLLTDSIIIALIGALIGWSNKRFDHDWRRK